MCLATSFAEAAPALRTNTAERALGRRLLGHRTGRLRVLSAAVLVFVAASPWASEALVEDQGNRGGPHVSTPKHDCENLLNAVLPFARQMLSQHREFYPFGATMSPSGQITHVAGPTGAEHPPSAEVIRLLESGFRDGALQGKFRATALVVDVRTVPPGKSAKQDAISVRLDHRDHYSVEVLIPYSFGPSGELRVEDPFAAKGVSRIFAE